MNIWKRNAVVATVVLFVCVALYLSWSYARPPADEIDADGEPVFTGTSDKILSPGTSGTTPSASPSVKPSASPLDNYFTEQRLSRQKARDSALAILTGLTEQNNQSAEEKSKANAELTALAAQALAEAKIEGLVISKGFSDCMAYISEGTINVIVAPPGGGLTATDVVKIQDVVVSETAFSPEKIRVQEAIANS